MIDEILSDIEELKKRTTRPLVTAGINMVLEIIKKHSKNNGWIPCSERLPETSEYMEFEPTPHMKRIEISYMTDTVEYLIGFYDSSKWMDKHHNIIKNVIAWKPFLKLPEECHG